jgi:hypothetical protein
VKQGTIAEYTIVGWVGFVVTGYRFAGNSNDIYGHFTPVTWDAVETDLSKQADYGVRTIILSE